MQFFPILIQPQAVSKPVAEDLYRFIFDDVPVRGAIVRLGDAWREGLARRAAVGAFPAPVRQLLGEMAAAGVLMQSGIRFDGALILQLHGDGPLKLAVAEVRSDLGLRTTAQVTGPIADGDGLQNMANVAGQGRCAITLDPDEKGSGNTAYQGMVPLHGDQKEPLQALSQALEHYMLQSEQLDTRMVLAANDDVAAGVFLQRMPLAGGERFAGLSDEDLIGKHEGFNRLAHLLATLTSDELLRLDVKTVLHRLFWDEQLRLFEPETVRFYCSCGRERVSNMLIGLGREEVDGIIEECETVEVGCDFCGRQYRFDAVDVAGMFAAVNEQPDAPKTIQ